MSGIIAGLLGAFFPPAPEPLDEVEPGRTAVVRGRVMPRDLLRSPLSGAECIYYLPHRKWCDLPELPVPVEPQWWCRLWKL